MGFQSKYHDFIQQSTRFSTYEKSFILNGKFLYKSPIVVALLQRNELWSRYTLGETRYAHYILRCRSFIVLASFIMVLTLKPYLLEDYFSFERFFIFPLCYSLKHTSFRFCKQ